MLVITLKKNTTASMANAKDVLIANAIPVHKACSVLCVVQKYRHLVPKALKDGPAKGEAQAEYAQQQLSQETVGHYAPRYLQVVLGHGESDKDKAHRSEQSDGLVCVIAALESEVCHHHSEHNRQHYAGHYPRIGENGK